MDDLDSMPLRAEAAAWHVAIMRGLNISHNDLRAMLVAANEVRLREAQPGTLCDVCGAVRENHLCS